MSHKRLLIADDHELIREGLKAHFSTSADWVVVGEVSTITELEQTVTISKPDVLILDLKMPGGDTISAITRLTKIVPELRVLVLSAHGDSGVVRAVLDAGAHGFIGKEASADDLEAAMVCILKGDEFVQFQSQPEKLKDYSDDDGFDELSVREKEVFRLLGQGVKNKEIARRLFLSPKTIDVHRANILRKLDASSTAELVQVAIKRGLIDE
ncbi:MAG: response regulator transcription factor [bacterium]|nr:response regulator transcription factor [bacterium]